MLATSWKSSTDFNTVSMLAEVTKASYLVVVHPMNIAPLRAKVFLPCTVTVSPNKYVFASVGASPEVA